MDASIVREVLDRVRADGRTALTAPEGKRICDAYEIATPGEGVATTAEEAIALARDLGFPVVLKVVSPDILHKTEAGGVLVGVSDVDSVAAGFDAIMTNAHAYNPAATITGVQVQQQVGAGQEVIIGATSDPTFGKLVAFGLGGVLVEVLKDVTFRLAPLDSREARSMVDGIKAAELLRG